MEKTRTGKVHVWLYSILAVCLAAAVIWGFTGMKNADALELSVENQYERAFHEMVGHIDKIDSLLNKTQLASSPAHLAKLSSDIFRESAEAKSALGQLPTTEVNLENTSKFLSQVGDYTYVLSQGMINGEKISEEEYKNIASLNEYASSLKDTLSKMQEQLYNGEIHLSDLGKKRNKNAAKAASGDILADLENVEKSFEEYPALIYDGPFSEHIENQQSVMINNSEELTKEEAQRKAEEFLGDRGRGIKYSTETSNTAIDAYTFTKSTSDEQITVSVTKRGGYVLYFLDNITVNNENYGVDEAIKAGKQFLEERGINDMQSSYYEKTNGVATINFAYSKDGITYYSDLVKVKVALDTGEIVGMEAKGYLMNHKDRNLSEPKLTAEEAKEHISTNLEVSETKLALVPKDSMREVLCYEFKGVFNDKNFIVYINADNGREENILILIESPEGVLTI